MRRSASAANAVSHHPPVTAYHLENQAAQVIVEGFSGQKTSFTGRSIHVHQVGHAMLRVRVGDATEEYLITLPTLHIDGLWLGSPYIELANNSYIHSSTGLLASIHYSGKGYFSGKAHSFEAHVTDASQNTVLEVAGNWSGLSHVTKGTLLPIDSVFLDANAEPREEISVKPIEAQDAYESRRLWKVVAQGIRSGNYDVASRDKSRIENEQRALRKERAAKNTPHQLKYFTYLEKDPSYAKLVGPCKHQPAEQHAYVFTRSP